MGERDDCIFTSLTPQPVFTVLQSTWDLVQVCFEFWAPQIEVNTALMLGKGTITNLYLQTF